MLSLKNIDYPKYQNSFNYKDSIFLIGSCFAENINECLNSDNFKTIANPFGILFNPKSIANILDRILSKKYYNENDFFFFDNYYWCYEHHGSLAQTDINNYINDSNKLIDSTYKYLSNCSLLLITFGTAYVYTINNKVVSNCHKQPSNLFNSFNLSIDEITHDYSNLFQKIKMINPKIQIILTISPVRYISQGFVENNVSKSILHLAKHNLINKFDYVYYFPSFEYFIDIFRDYSFFNEDGIHPNKIAIDQIYKLFLNHILDLESLNYLSDWFELKKLLNHKILHPLSLSNITFQDKLNLKKEVFISKYGINL